MRWGGLVVCLVLLRAEELAGAPAQLSNDVLIDLSATPAPAPAEGVGTPYAAENNFVDDGHHPEDQTYGTQEQLDQPPPGTEMKLPRVSDVGVRRCTISWDAPGAPVAGYRLAVFKANDGALAFSQEAVSESELAMVVDGLQGNTQYFFKVAALVGASMVPGAFSDPSQTITTKTGVPAKLPVKPMTSEVALRSVKLSWVAPKDDGGSAVTGYRITMREDATTTGGAEFYEKIANTKSIATTIVLDKLDPDGHVYEFVVEAINSEGQSEPSPSSDPIRTLYTTVCGPVKGLEANAVDGSTVRLTWKLPDDTGAPPTGYRFFVQPHGKGPYKRAPDFVGNLKNRVQDMVDLKAGTNYRFRVVAVNKAGVGSIQVTDLVTTKPGVPGKVTKPTTGFVTASSCMLQWMEPKAYGERIVGYRVLMQTGGVGGFTEKIANTGNTRTQTTITGLEHGGTEYQFRVQAINAIGPGPESPPSDAMITLYSDKTATARAVKQAHDEFKAHEKIHELGKLKMENERYNKELMTQKKIVKNTEEMAQKSRKLASQTRLRLDIEKRMCKKKLDMEATFGQKSVRLQVDKFSKMAQLEKVKWAKRMSMNNKHWRAEITKKEGLAMQQMESLTAKSKMECTSKLKDTTLELKKASTLKIEAEKAKVKQLANDLKSAAEDSKQRVKETRDHWKEMLDKQVEKADAKILELHRKIGGLEIKLKTYQAEEDTKPNSTKTSAGAQVEMSRLLKVRAELKKTLESTKQEQEKRIIKLSQLQRESNEGILETKDVIKSKGQQEVTLTTKLQEAEVQAKKLKQEAAEGAHRSSMFLNLGEAMKSFDEKGKKDLEKREYDANRRVKELKNKKLFAAEQRKAAENKLAQQQTTKAAVDSEIRVAMNKLASARNGSEFQKSEALVAVVAQEVENLKNKQELALNKSQEIELSGMAPISKSGQNFDLPCGNESVTEEEIMENFPQSGFEFDLYWDKSRALAIQQMHGKSEVQKKVLQSCEMQKNCLALGGGEGECNTQTMCSKGNPSRETRPCKTCMSLFKVQKWRELHGRDLKRCDSGSTDCRPTPYTWTLCQKTDNSTVCPPFALGVSPVAVEDAAPADSHCTSCHDGDSLEILHPATKTGYCRANGPADGSAAVTAPHCHDKNDASPSPGSQEKVCTHIQRSHAVVKGSPAEGWLKGYNEYAYVTCNARKMLHCKPVKDRLSSLVRPASQGPKVAVLERTKCTTEKSVTCETACRLRLDGNLCQVGDEACASDRSWNYDEAQAAMRKLLTPIRLAGLDCDPARCTSELCQTVALGM